MFSYDKDIYKRIMKPAGLQYLVDSDTEKELKKHSPKNQEEYWNFLYPQEIVALMGISRPEAFSSISKGNFDKQYVSISSIYNLKLSLKGKNSYFKAIYDHLCRILEDCASIDTMIYVEKKSEKSEEYLASALAMRVAIAAKKGEANSTEVAWTCCNLASLLTKYPDRYEDAEHFIEDALSIYKELDKEFPEQHASSLARTYTAYGRLLAKWKGRREDALEAFKKALEINVTLEHDYPGVYTNEIEVIKKELDFMEKSL